MKIAICTLWQDAQVEKGDNVKREQLYKNYRLLKNREGHLSACGWQVCALGQLGDMEKALAYCTREGIQHLWIHLQPPAGHWHKVLIARLGELKGIQIYLDGSLEEHTHTASPKKIGALAAMGIRYLNEDELPTQNMAGVTG